MKIAATDVRQHASIAPYEEMLKSLEFRQLDRGNTADAARQTSALQNVITQAQRIVEAYRKQAPILTQGQCDYLQTIRSGSSERKI